MELPLRRNKRLRRNIPLMFVLDVSLALWIEHNASKNYFVNASFQNSASLVAGNRNLTIRNNCLQPFCQAKIVPLSNLFFEVKNLWVASKFLPSEK